MARVAVVTTAAVIGALSLPAPEAFAGHVSCGETITVDTTLDSDVTECSSDGIRIGADNITLDLNGHTVDGEVAFGSGNGIENAGFDGVTIENGTVQEFSLAAVSLQDAAANHVRVLNIPTALGDGIRVQGNSSSTLIEDNRVENAVGIAVAIGGASNVRVERNLASGNGLAGGGKIGAVAVLGDANRIEGNNVRLVQMDGVGAGVGRGSLVVTGGSGNEIVGNTANDSDTEGIVVESGATGTLVRGNLAERNGPGFVGFGNGITVESASTSLAANSANFNDGLGIGGFAGPTDLGGNRAQGNGDPDQCEVVRCDTSPRLFGKRAASTSYSQMSAHAKRASAFPLYFPVTVRKLSAYLDGRGAASGSQVLRAVIYKRSGSSPGELVARSFQATIAAGLEPGWVDFYMPFPPRLQPGVYWLGLHSGATNGVARFAWDPVASSRRFNGDNYGDGPSNPFGTAALDNQGMSIYASGSY